MLGVLYLILAWMLGLGLMLRWDCVGRRPGAGKIILIVSFALGALLQTWLTYVLAYWMRNLPSPLAAANGIVMSLGAVASVLLLRNRLESARLAFKNIARSRAEAIFVTVLFVYAAFLMFYTYRIVDQQQLIGFSVWSDFGPHLAMIRSFSEGKNFPTGYPHYASDTVRYHFLFQFFVGNLEYLGLRLDWAFNIPSIISFGGFLAMLYELGLSLTRVRAVGVLSVFLFVFRSSLGFWTHLASVRDWKELLQKTAFLDFYVGKTEHEVWGLFNQNVYINQRHLAFALIFMLFFVWLLHRKSIRWLARMRRLKFSQILREIFISARAWCPQHVIEALGVGIILGLLGFWNGAVVIACLGVMGVFAFFSDRKTEFLMIAAVGVVLVMAESRFFTGAGSTVSPEFYLGFLAPERTIVSMLRYIAEMSGVFVPAAVLGVILAPSRLRLWALAFVVPGVIAFSVRLTPDINMNHKFIIFSIMLLNIPVAYGLQRIWRVKKVVARVLVCLLLFLLTCTGLLDLVSLVNQNRPARTVRVDEANPVLKWILTNTTQRAVFLSHEHVINAALMAGRRLYYGWPYYAWSAGYPTDKHKVIQQRIYSSHDPVWLKETVAREKIHYIVVESDNRQSREYKFTDDGIKSAFELVFETADHRLQIYRTGVPEI